MHEMPEAIDTTNEQEISLSDVLTFLNKYKKMILGVALVAGLLAAVVAMRMPDVYTAKLKLIPPPQAQLVQAALESESFAGILARRFELAQVYGVENINDARDRLMSLAHAKSGKDGTIGIEVDDVDPKRAAAIANAYPEELDKFIASRGLSDSIRQQQRTEFRIQELQERLAHTKKKLDESGEKRFVNGLIQEKEKKENIATLRAQLDFILEGDASITKAMPSLDRLREQLDRLFQPVTTERKKPIGIPEQDYLEQFSQAKYLEASVELLKGRLALLKIDEQMAHTRVLDSASVPERKSKPKRLSIVISAMLAAAFITVLMLALKEWIATTRKQVNQVTPAL